ncbi:MAG: hypothetical protein IAF02_23555 [Anaerolineae bacterium]|nr:hypothetical protein [Anaerolineae bacterium]
MNKYFIIFGLILALILTACGGTASEPAATSGNGAAAQAGDAVRLSENYSNALPVQAQLAIGMLQLENGDKAVDETEAAALLPLWQAVQSLSNSETAADAEVTAVLNQIQDTMTPEQVAAIAAMQLTDESFQAMLADGTISMRGAFGGNRGADGADGAGGAGFPGGGPGGGLPGGGGGQGGGPGGGLPGADPSAQQTRIAERIAESGGDASGFQTAAMTGAVVRLLQTKTGVAPENGFPNGGIMGEAITAVTEATGLSAEAVQTALSEGKTLADIITENGGDVETITATLTEALAGSDFLQGQDAETFVTDFLNGAGFPNGRSGNE